MILLDTNILIYLHDGQLTDAAVAELRSSSLDTCNIIVAEVLGYASMGPYDAKYFEALFATMNNRLLDMAVTNKVVELRRTNGIKLPDAIIAATALVHNLVLWTNNTDDFKNIPNLQLFNPISV